MKSPARIALVAAALSLAAGATTAPAATAVPSAATKCSAWKTITITGGRAKYRECTRTANGKQQVNGTFQLWDTKHDGKSVQAYARTDYNHWYGDKVTWEHFYGWPNESRPSPQISSGWHEGDDFELTIERK
ncbi:hypothetical protein ACIG53_06880 [Streptomyces bauhiniae]|uniref:hypothetical protein n=1 Tax=Streptomyces bauhiniae TaxID=2340725 RepID=UPI0037D1A671